ncbi:hypothetical protein QF001_001685 [Paraburkholderia youngii]
MSELRCDSRFITTWRPRFSRERLGGLTGGAQVVRRAVTWRALRREVLDYTLRRKPADGSTRWSSRNLAGS